MFNYHIKHIIEQPMGLLKHRGHKIAYFWVLGAGEPGPVDWWPEGRLQPEEMGLDAEENRGRSWDQPAGRLGPEPLPSEDFILPGNSPVFGSRYFDHNFLNT